MGVFLTKWWLLNSLLILIFLLKFVFKTNNAIKLSVFEITFNITFSVKLLLIFNWSNCEFSKEMLKNKVTYVQNCIEEVTIVPIVYSHICNKKMIENNRLVYNINKIIKTQKYSQNG